MTAPICACRKPRGYPRPAPEDAMTYHLRLLFDAAPPGSMIPGSQAHIIVGDHATLDDGSIAVPLNASARRNYAGL